MDKSVLLVGERIKALDGIRGLAIGMVLLWHLFIGETHFAVGSVGAYAQRLGSLLWMGVDLFFVLSGFLITGLLMDSRQAEGYFKKFYVRRAFRIVPAYAVLLIAYWLTSHWTGITPAAREWLLEGCPPLWSCLIFFQNYMMGYAESSTGKFLSSTWSLAVEEQFYLILPLVVRVCSGRLLWLALMSMFFIGWGVKAWLFMAGVSAASVWMPLPCRLDAFMAGSLGAVFIKDILNSQACQWLGAHHLSITLTGFAIFFGISIAMPVLGFRWLALGGATLTAVVFGVVVASSAVATNSFAWHFLCHPWLVGLGTISYGMYLFHMPINGVLHALVRQAKPSTDDLFGVLVTCLGFGMTIGLCVLSWIYFERPLVEYGRKITKRVMPI
jgi:peptidoglycan/LPS O-acetylase OafA/YrhL